MGRLSNKRAEVSGGARRYLPRAVLAQFYGFRV